MHRCESLGLATLAPFTPSDDLDPLGPASVLVYFTESPAADVSPVAGWRPSPHLVRVSAEKPSMTSHRDHLLFRRFPTSVFMFFVLGIVRMTKCPKALVIKLMGGRLLSNFLLLMTFNWDLGDLSGCKARLQSDPGVNILTLWG